MKFTDHFKCDSAIDYGIEGYTTPAILENESPITLDLLISLQGKSFNKGLYRFHNFEDVPKLTEEARNMFQDFSKRIICFASDWLGRQFALDSKRIAKGEKLILMLEPGTGQVLEIPVNFVNFHEDELINYTNEALASDFHDQWLKEGGLIPENNECIGYKVPLFLGGDDEISNLERIDMQLYWSLCAQLFKQTINLPNGTKINDIKLQQ